MKITKKQKFLTWIAGLLIVLIITNPSTQSFKEYVGSNTYSGIYKEKNFFIASLYTYHRAIYLGIVGNFVREGYEHYYTDSTVDTVRDTASNTSVKLTISEFAARIKKKYPKYNNLDNKTLVNKIISMYPQYKENVDLQSN